MLVRMKTEEWMKYEAMYRAIQAALATRLTDFGWERQGSRRAGKRGANQRAPEVRPQAKFAQGECKVSVSPLQTENSSSGARMSSDSETEVRQNGNGSGSSHHR